MSLTINSDAFVLEDLFAELSTVDSVSIWQSQYAFQFYTPSYLNADGPYTIFVPNDDAVADILNVLSLGQFGIFDLPNFGEILEYHIAEGLYFEDDLYDGLMLTSAQGQELTITENESGFLVDNAQIVNSNYTAYNGVIHVIDKCLAPSSSPEATVMQIITDSPNHEIFEEAILALGLDDELSSLVILDNDGSGIPEGPGPWTIFAPTDEAFAALPDGMLDDLLADPNALKQILLYHVVGDVVMTETVVTLNNAETLEGSTVAIEVVDGNVFLNDSKVTSTDIEASNGVIHVIDKVLVPGMDETGSNKELIDSQIPNFVVYEYIDPETDYTFRRLVIRDIIESTLEKSNTKSQISQQIPVGIYETSQVQLSSVIPLGLIEAQIPQVF
jgi:uncharacterized surface protein with fasciclin (FAS1) repeats